MSNKFQGRRFHLFFVDVPWRWSIPPGWYLSPVMCQAFARDGPDYMRSMNQSFILRYGSASHRKGIIQARMSIRWISSIGMMNGPVGISCPGMWFHGHAIPMNLFAIGSNPWLLKRHGIYWNYSCDSKLDSWITACRLIWESSSMSIIRN